MTATNKHPVFLLVILAGYFIIGTAYILHNPLWEAPDEIHHFPMVQYLQTHGLQLPSQAEGTVGLWQQEGNQPPLYYILGALLISPIDTSDIDEVMRVNPHADIGIIRPDGNPNRLVHLPTEGFPASGAMLATYVLRFFSLLLGGCTVFVTYLIGREIFPEQPSIALTAAGLNAFLPMYLYISASVNNDNLSNLLGNLLILLLIRLIKHKEKPALKTYIIIGIVTGAGLLSKLNIGLLIPVIALVFLWLSIRLRAWRPFVLGGFISGGLTIAIAGWWYFRNWILFGDPTGLDHFLDIVGRRAIPADIAQLWTERTSFIRTFWGLFGSINVPMSNSLYLFFNLFAGLSVISLIIYLGYTVLKHIRGKHHQDRYPIHHTLATSLTILWPVLTFIALLRWTSITPASQGRLIYGAISSIMLWFAVGLLWWIPQRWRRWMGSSVLVIMAIIAALQPFKTIAPEYALSESINVSDNPLAIFTANDSQIAVHDYEILTPDVTPDSYVEVIIELEAVSQYERDWSIFVHLVTEEGIIIGQRDVYPARGLMATSDIQAGFAWENPIAIYVPQTAYTPNTIEIRFGLYHLPTGERMVLDEGADMLTIGQVILVTANQTGIPNRQMINFGNQIELIGYDVTTLNPTAGDTLELTLYWQARQPIDNDYVVFANVIDPATLTKYADSNAMPVQWTRPTSTWNVGEIIEDTHTLTIREDAVAGVYPIEVGLYLQEDGFPRLGVMGTYDNYIYLTPIRITGGE